MHVGFFSLLFKLFVFESPFPHNHAVYSRDIDWFSVLMKYCTRVLIKRIQWKPEAYLHLATTVGQ